MNKPLYFPEGEQLLEIEEHRKNIEVLIAELQISMIGQFIGLIKYFFPLMHMEEAKLQATSYLHDAICKVYIKYYSKGNIDLNELTQFRGRVYSTGRNQCLNEVKKIARLRGNEPLVDFSISSYCREYATEENDIESRDKVMIVINFLRTLPETQFKAFYYNTVLDWTHKRISQELGISEKYSKTLCSKVRKIIIKKFGEDYFIS